MCLLMHKFHGESLLRVAHEVAARNEADAEALRSVKAHTWAIRKAETYEAVLAALEQAGTCTLPQAGDTWRPALTAVVEQRVVAVTRMLAAAVCDTLREMETDPQGAARLEDTVRACERPIEAVCKLKVFVRLGLDHCSCHTGSLPFLAQLGGAGARGRGPLLFNPTVLVFRKQVV